MSQGVDHGSVSVVMSSWGNHMSGRSVYMVGAGNVILASSNIMDVSDRFRLDIGFHIASALGRLCHSSCYPSMSRNTACVLCRHFVGLHFTSLSSKGD